MKRSGVIILILIIVLPALGAVAGRVAAPELARLDYIVRLAKNVRQSELHPAPAGEKEKPVMQMTQAEKDVKAFKSLGMPSATLYAQANEVLARFRTGSTWFGLFCGLVTALTIASDLKRRQRNEYDADPADCLACARCYQSCPVERERLERALGERAL